MKLKFLVKKLPITIENEIRIQHNCKALSTNRLFVEYDPNTEDASGYMSRSCFLYHGGNIYEGKEIVVDSYVKDNEFSRTGYTFKGWATSPSGPVKYAPGTPLSMLKSEYATPTNGATITLYAVWEAKKGGVNIVHQNIAKGGAAYTDNANGTTQADGNWISNEISYPNGITLNGTVTLPTGYTATFDAYTNGGTVEGNSLKEITAKTHLVSKVQTANNSSGSYNSATNEFVLGYKGGRDEITFYYDMSEITMPSAERDGYVFLGWYTEDTDGEYVGKAGDTMLLTEDITLYAKFSTMEVAVEDVYYKPGTGTNSFGYVAMDESGQADNDYSTPNNALAVQNAVGAVNLSMSMLTTSDSVIYQPYMKLSAANAWSKLSTVAGEEVESDEFDEVFTSVGSDTYEVESTGLYKLEAFGANGGDRGASHNEK